MRFSNLHQNQRRMCTICFLFISVKEYRKCQIMQWTCAFSQKYSRQTLMIEKMLHFRSTDERHVCTGIFCVLGFIIMCKIGSAESNIPPKGRRCFTWSFVWLCSEETCSAGDIRGSVQAVHRNHVACGDQMCMADASRKPCVDMLQEGLLLMRAINRLGLPFCNHVLVCKRKVLGKLLLEVSASQEGKKV